MNKKTFIVGAALTAMVMVAGVARADVIPFSGPLSDDDAPASVFDARVDYTYLNLEQILCVTIFNDTVAPNEYTISRLHFNTSFDVIGLALITDQLSPYYNADFPDASLGGASAQGGFGTFRWSLDLGQGNDGVLAGQSTTFYFDVQGSGLTDDDFFRQSQIIPGGSDKPFGVALIHFTRGPGDDSVWALSGQDGVPLPPGDIFIIPEPASMTLLGLGLAAMAIRRRRMHQ
jgi:hypothetical protein